MKELLVQYAAYNHWANGLIIQLLSDLSEEQLHQDLGGSFPSAYKTATHIWMAESVWLQRLQMAEHIIVPTENFSGDFVEACKLWTVSSEGLLHFTKKINDERGLTHEFHYKNIKGETFKSKVYECLQHVANHSTFHRGQLINFLRQLGVTKIPSTDFITFCRMKKG